MGLEVDELAGRLELDQLAGRLELDELAGRLELVELAGRLERLELDEQSDRLEVDDHVQVLLAVDDFGHVPSLNCDEQILHHQHLLLVGAWRSL